MTFNNTNAFLAVTTDGERVTVSKTYRGQTYILEDEAGNTYERDVSGRIQLLEPTTAQKPPKRRGRTRKTVETPTETEQELGTPIDPPAKKTGRERNIVVYDDTALPDGAKPTWFTDRQEEDAEAA